MLLVIKFDSEDKAKNQKNKLKDKDEEIKLSISKKIDDKFILNLELPTSMFKRFIGFARKRLAIPFIASLIGYVIYLIAR